MRGRAWTGVATIGVVLLAGAGWSADGDQEEDRSPRDCSMETLRGTYGIQIQGTRPAAPPAPAGTIESVIGVIVRDYDGRGHFTQINNEKGSVSGPGPADRVGAGTYQVNEDCTGSHQLQNEGSPVVVTDRFVIVDRGREVRSYVVTPSPVMVTGVSQKVDRH